MSSLSSAPKSSRSTIVTHNAGKPTAFSYSVTLIKNGTGKQIDIVRMVASFDLYQSISNMALCSRFVLVDAADAFVQNGIQPGDRIKVEAYKDATDKRKINNTYTILSVDAGERIKNSKGRTYTVSATDIAAINNKKITLNKAYNDTISGMITDIAQQLGVSNTTFDASVKTVNYIAHNQNPFDVISIMLPYAISSKYGEGQAHFYYQTSESTYFQPLAGIVDLAQKANNVWDYILSTNINMTGDANTDMFRVIAFTHTVAADQGERMSGGIFESEVVQFNHMTRTLDSQKYQYKNDYKKLQTINKNPIVDLKHNYDDWITPADDKGMWKRSYVYTRPNSSLKGIAAGHSSTFAYAQAQVALLNQNVFHLDINGNPSMNVGDLIQLEASKLSGDTEPALDKLLHGKFIVGNLRHRMTSAGEQFMTHVDVFSDAPAFDIYTDKSTPS